MLKIRFLWFIGFLSLIYTPFSAVAQVRLVQWTDVHSTLATQSQQIRAIDLLGQEFLQRNPQGEFVVYVIGDYTSLNPYSQLDDGQLSMDGLKLLTERGYTVLFTPGNHDALDWSGRIEGIELFFQQMKQLRGWGVQILAANFKNVREPFKSLLSDSYNLKSLKIKTHIVGMTLENLFEKSNLNEPTAKRLFKGVRSYENTLKEFFPVLGKQGVEQIIVGAHEGHARLSQLVDHFSKFSPADSAIQVPLLLAADDHLVSAYYRSNSLIADAGSHGSFNVIDFDEIGKITSQVLHVAITKESATHIKPEQFTYGRAVINSVTAVDIEAEPFTQKYEQEIVSFMRAADQNLQKVLAHTFPYETHKKHMKVARTHLGSLLSESLVRWVNSIFKPSAFSEPVIGFVNSSSYRLENPIAGGSMNEFFVRGIYPFLNPSAVYRLDGKDVERLFFSLRRYYARNNKTYYSPQLDLHTREFEGRLQVYSQGQWDFIKKKTSYLVAFDGWLSEHRFGQSFRIKEWLEILQKHKPVATKPFQDILVDHLPGLLAHNPERMENFLPENVESQELLSGSRCIELFR